MDFTRNTNEDSQHHDAYARRMQGHHVQPANARPQRMGHVERKSVQPLTPRQQYAQKLAEHAQAEAEVEKRAEDYRRMCRETSQRVAQVERSAPVVQSSVPKPQPKIKRSFAAEAVVDHNHEEDVLSYLSEDSPRSRYFADAAGPGHFGDHEYGQGVVQPEPVPEQVTYANVEHAGSKEHAIYQLGQKQPSENVPFFGMATYMPEYADIPRYTDEDVVGVHEGQYGAFSLRELFVSAPAPDHVSVSTVSYRFAVMSLVCVLMLSSVLFVGHAFAVKNRVEHSAAEAIGALQSAMTKAQKGDFSGAQMHISLAQSAFESSQEDLSTINQFIISLSRYVPGASKLSSGDALVRASVDLTKGVERAAHLGEILTGLEALSDEEIRKDFSFLALANDIFEDTHAMEESFVRAQDALADVRIVDVPEAQKEEFLALMDALPELIALLRGVNDIDHAMNDLFGAEGPRKYLFLFQNNHEMRATGGFIGSYGFMDINEGKVREFKIDGIYNPDGQLTDKVVPPRPIQKISAAWSLHDSNWWPDFPKSAEKAIEFYERTGGPTVDGVITMTPEMVERLMELTGPITLETYGVTLTGDNFIEQIQYKVEVDYDKEENRPKKILSDLMPTLMDELKKDMTAKKALNILQIFFDGLNERHILVYADNDVIQKTITDQHWGGQLLTTSQDYMSVVHSNINGFKTDGVIDEEIEHHTSIETDGRIINTVTVTRSHGGGDTGYEWWDKVNANYMRMYVPQGSRLISAEGHTREINEPRLNYDALGYERDVDVVTEEQNLRIDPVSGTRIYEDSGKTVFGNWVYVSPQEVVRVTYVYELPWRVSFESDEKGQFGGYGIVHQKQAGAENITLKSTISLPEKMQIISAVPQRDGVMTNETQVEFDFVRDYYHGVVFRVK